ncbi:uncharacterized protein LY79DRAFT_569090, partial [Colletotrichum navitas]
MSSWRGAAVTRTLALGYIITRSSFLQAEAHWPSAWCVFSQPWSSPPPSRLCFRRHLGYPLFWQIGGCLSPRTLGLCKTLN